MEAMGVLGIETSCDETAAAVVAEGALKSSVVRSQIERHRPYGGVVPEIASRLHVEALPAVVEEALSRAALSPGRLAGLAATQGPGLVGALVVGLSFAKAMASALSIPVTGVNHVHAHIAALWLEPPPPTTPLVALVASGGHTSLYLVRDLLNMEPLGATRDDAAGEAFDKVAKLLGLPYPGGPSVAERALHGDPLAIPFPRPMLPDTPYDFSFSGLKTAVIQWVRAHQPLGPREIAHVCASFQEAVVDVLVAKARRAVEETGVKSVALCGGVAANARLVEKMGKMAHDSGVEFFVPSPPFCTDNGAMVALLGARQLEAGLVLGPDADCYSRTKE